GEFEHLLAAVQVPDPHGAIHAGRGETSTGEESQAVNRIQLSPEPLRSMAGCRVPDHHLTGKPTHSSGRGESLAVGAESHGEDRVALSPKGPEFLPCRRLPDRDRAIVAGRGELAAIGAKGH